MWPRIALSVMMPELSLSMSEFMTALSHWLISSSSLLQ